jgi:hypothetical protein
MRLTVKAVTPAVISEQVILTLEYLLGFGTSAMTTPCLAAVNFRSMFPEAACDPFVQPPKPFLPESAIRHSTTKKKKKK